MNKKRILSLLLAFCMLISAISIDTVVNAAEPTNIALSTNGTTITTNRISSYGEEHGFGLTQMINGDADDNGGITATCEKDDETTLDLTFNQSYLVSEVRMRTRELGTAPIDYTLSVWTASGWKEIVKVTDRTHLEDYEWFEHEFEAVACRAVRLSVTEHGKDGGGTHCIMLREFEAYGVQSAETIGEPVPLTNVARDTNETTITSSHISSYGEEHGFGLDMMINGNADDNGGITETCDQYDEQTVDLTFKQSYFISKVRMRTRELGTAPVDYTLSVWTASGWKEIVKVTDRTHLEDYEWFEHEFPSVACRAVRLSVTEHGKDGGGTHCIMLREFEAYGVQSAETIGEPVPLTNVARDTNETTITSSHISNYGETHGYGLANMIDGESEEGQNFSITASCGQYDEQTVDLTFKQSYFISKVRLKTRELGTAPVDYTLSVWTASGWKEIVKVTDRTHGADYEWIEHEFQPVACRAVRLSVTEHGKDGGGTYCIMLREFEAYGIESTETIGAPAPLSNVALASNGTTIASNRISSFAKRNNISLDKMIDGNDANYGITGTCDKDDETTLDLIFKQSYAVSKVRMRARELSTDPVYATAPVDYTLSVWTANGWEEVVKVEDHVQSESDEWLEHEFDAVACRAVRLSVTEHGCDGGKTHCIYLREIEAYGIPSEAVITEPPMLYNLAYGMQVTAGSGDTLNYLVDNSGASYNSAFSTVASNYEWVQVTFDAPVRAYYVEFTPWTSGELKRFPKDFCIEVYNGTEWETVIEKTDYSEEVYIFEFAEPKECSAIRLAVTQLDNGDSDTNYVLLIEDMKVFGECANVTLQRPDEVGQEMTRSEAAVVLGKGTNLEALKDNLRSEAFNTYQSQIVENAEDEVSIQFLFGRSLYVDSVKFYAHSSVAGSFPTDFEIYAFTGDNWEKVRDVTGYTCKADAIEHYFSFKGVYCNSIMIVASGLYELDGGYGMKLQDIQILGSFKDDACALLGDGSGDGTLTEAEDCTAFREYIVNSSESSMRYDINMDATGDVRDLVRMKQYFIGN